MPKGNVYPIEICCLNCSQPFLKLKVATKHCSIACRKAYNYKLKKQSNRPYDRSSMLKYLYKISLADYNHMVEKSNGKCNICFQTPTKSLHVDHNHFTGEVRGLLCANCNTGLGLFKEKIEFLDSAKSYLTRGIK